MKRDEGIGVMPLLTPPKDAGYARVTDGRSSKIAEAPVFRKSLGLLTWRLPRFRSLLTMVLL